MRGILVPREALLATISYEMIRVVPSTGRQAAGSRKPLAREAVELEPKRPSSGRVDRPALLVDLP